MFSHLLTGLFYKLYKHLLTKKIFVSYSRNDIKLVEPIVRILRINTQHVFYDADSIEPGEKWQEKINAAISGATLLVLFWCKHSDQSEEVKQEYTVALRNGKQILPVLLDNTPLRAELSEFQWIDFRDISGPSHEGYSYEQQTRGLWNEVFRKRKELRVSQQELDNEIANQLMTRSYSLDDIYLFDEKTKKLEHEMDQLWQEVIKGEASLNKKQSEFNDRQTQMATLLEKEIIDRIRSIERL
jgi:hypothetical protein